MDPCAKIANGRLGDMRPWRSLSFAAKSSPHQQDSLFQLTIVLIVPSWHNLLAVRRKWTAPGGMRNGPGPGRGGSFRIHVEQWPLFPRDPTLLSSRAVFSVCAQRILTLQLDLPSIAFSDNIVPTSELGDLHPGILLCAPLEQLSKGG